MYPDNAKMGQSLAKLALKTAKAGSKKTNTMLPLRDLLIAFNVRTAEHLGLDVDRKQRDEFDLVFPPQ
jgi:putative ABC transport system substrate-binding protein